MTAKSTGFPFGIRLPNGLAPSFPRPVALVSHSEIRCAVVILCKAWMPEVCWRFKEAPSLFLSTIRSKGKYTIMNWCYGNESGVTGRLHRPREVIRTSTIPKISGRHFFIFFYSLFIGSESKPPDWRRPSKISWDSQGAGEGGVRLLTKILELFVGFFLLKLVLWQRKWSYWKITQTPGSNTCRSTIPKISGRHFCSFYGRHFCSFYSLFIGGESKSPDWRRPSKIFWDSGRRGRGIRLSTEISRVIYRLLPTGSAKWIKQGRSRSNQEDRPW
jgi:hypothetical protein